MEQFPQDLLDLLDPLVRMGPSDLETSLEVDPHLPPECLEDPILVGSLKENIQNIRYSVCK